MAVVYIVQETFGRNFLPARKYGELQALLPGNAQVVLSAGPILYKLRKGLKLFCDDDYLLLTGDPAIMGMAMLVAANFNHGRVQVLKWDKQQKDYYVVAIDSGDYLDDD
jgi:hypothetical protein